MIAIQKTVKPMWEVRSTYDICLDIMGVLDCASNIPRAELRRSGRMHISRSVRNVRLPGGRGEEMGVIDQRIATEQQALRLPISAPTPRLTHLHAVGQN